MEVDIDSAKIQTVCGVTANTFDELQVGSKLSLVPDGMARAVLANIYSCIQADVPELNADRGLVLSRVLPLIAHQDPIVAYRAASLLYHYSTGEACSSDAGPSLARSLPLPLGLFVKLLETQFTNWRWRNDQMNIVAGEAHSEKTHPDAGVVLSALEDEGKLKVILENAAVLCALYKRCSKLSAHYIQDARSAGEQLKAGTLQYNENGEITDSILRTCQRDMGRMHHELWLEARRKRQIEGNWKDPATNPHQGDIAYDFLPADEIKRLNFQVLANFKTLAELSEDDVVRLLA